MRKIAVFALLLFLLSLLLPAALCAADDPRARAIMERVDGRDDGDNRVCDMQMRLIDRSGGERLRRLRSYSRDRGRDTLELMFFLYPAEVERAGFLTWDYRDAGRDDDQWLFLPALRKTKRIASADKSGSFMGSDFSYTDLTRPALDDYDYTLEQEMEVRGYKVWVIRAVPRTREVVERTGYEKYLLLVRQDNLVVVRSVAWIAGSGDLKYMDVKKLERIDGIWVATEIDMATRRGRETRHRTVLTLSDVRFDQPLTEDFFSVRQLEKGP